MALRKSVRAALGVEEQKGQPAPDYLMDIVARVARVLFWKTGSLDLTAYDTNRREYQYGAQSLSVVISGGAATITFPKAFTSAPVVVAWGTAAITLTSVSTTAFVISGADATITVHYMVSGV